MPILGLYYDYQSGLYYDADKRLFYDGEKGKWLNYDATTGEYVPLENNAPENNCNSSSTESESEPDGENDPDSSHESTVSKSSCKNDWSF